MVAHNVSGLLCKSMAESLEYSLNLDQHQSCRRSRPSAYNVSVVVADAVVATVGVRIGQARR
jgi:hypothetical protein